MAKKEKQPEAQALTVQEPKTTALATQAPPSMAGIISSDVIIPRVLLMQGQSDFVQERKAQQGDIVRSTTAEKLGDPEHPIQVIPLKQTPVWFIENKAPGGQRFEWKSKVARTAGNDTLPWDYFADINGNEVKDANSSHGQWRRVKGIELFALLPADIAAYTAELKKAEEGDIPDLSKALTPVLITFRSTGMKLGGKAIVTHFSQAEQFKQKPYNYALSLGCYLDKNDEGSFYVFKVEGTPKKVDAAHRDAVQYWANIVETAETSLRVDEAKSEDAPVAGGQF